MKKKYMRLLGVAAVCLVLVIGCIVWMNVRKKDPDPSSDASDNVPVSQVGAENVVEMTYRCEDTENKDLTLVRDSDDVWHYAKEKDFPINQTYVTKMAQMLGTVEAERIIPASEAQELSEYGFENPLVTISFRERDGKESTYYVGNENASTENYYFRMEGDDNVYQINADLKVMFMMSLYDLFAMEEFPKVEESSFRVVTIQSGDKELRVKAVIEDDAEEYVTSDDYKVKKISWYAAKQGEDFRKGNQISLQAMIDEMEDYYFFRAVDYKVDQAGKAKYGLDKPLATITVDYEVLDETTARLVEVSDGVNEVQCDPIAKQYVLYVGNKTMDTDYADDYYVMIEGSDKVYTMEAASLSRMIDLDVDSYFVSAVTK